LEAVGFNGAGEPEPIDLGNAMDRDAHTPL